MAETAIPYWFSALLIAMTIGVMGYTAYWVERRYGPDKRALRKAWLKHGTIVGLAVLTTDILAIMAMARWA